MKLSKLYTEVITEQEILYHGTDSKYNDFDLDKVGTGDGRDLGGWGIYLTNDYDVAKQYITSKGKIEQFQLKRANFFNLDGLLRGDDERIFGHLQRLGTVSEDDLEQFQTDYMEYADEVTNKQTYDWLSYVLGSQKEASLFLKNVGYDGNKYHDKTNPEAMNYVVYDLSIIKRVQNDED